MSAGEHGSGARRCEIPRGVPQPSSMQQHAPNDQILCPHCGQSLSEDEIRSLLGQFGRAKWKKPQVSRFGKMTPEERKLASSKASKARWAKVREQASAWLA